MDPNPRIARRNLQAQVRGGRRSRERDGGREEACAGCWQQVISGTVAQERGRLREGLLTAVREMAVAGGLFPFRFLFYFLGLPRSGIGVRNCIYKLWMVWVSFFVHIIALAALSAETEIQTVF